MSNREEDIISENYKIIKDSVHGLIDLKPIIIKIIDTPEFQRLRHLKQLETLNYIYPCSVHTRFEHSIGTSFLARQFMEHLKKNQPNLNISDKEVLCVEIAGLCHDVGHGPFSHMFEDLIRRVYKKHNPSATKSECENFFVHEKASMLIFDRIFDNLKLSQEFKNEEMTDKDKNLIKELINPGLIKDIVKEMDKLNKENKSKKIIAKWLKSTDRDLMEKFGITTEKFYLFEIVSNFRNKIDVDKWDYFARDALNLGINVTFDYKRYILTSRVIKPDGGLNQICARDKELRNIYEMFRTREDLHRRAYQLPKAIGIKMMIVDTLIELDEVYDFYGIIKKLNSNLDDYLSLDDRVLYITSNPLRNLLALNKKSESLEKAKKIIRRLESRKLYKTVSIKIMKSDKLEKDSDQKVIEELLKEVNKIQNEDIFIYESRINFGNKDKDPLDDLNFYGKNNKIVEKADIYDYHSEMIPQNFEEIRWILFLKKENLSSKDNLFKELKEKFDDICNRLNSI